MTAGSHPQPVTVIRGSALLGSRVVQDSAVAFAGDRILYAGPHAGLHAALTAAAIDPDDVTALPLAPGQLAVPGLVDVHNHGGHGVDFPSATPASARNALHLMHAAGTTTVLASLVTASPADLFSGLDILAGLAESGDAAGIHLEGPFLSAVRCGAQDPQWLRSPDAGFTEELIDAARGHLRTMTYAPELPGADALVDQLAAHSVIPSLGHTAATAQDAEASLRRAAAGLAARPGMEAGGRAAVPTVTHLFNGMDSLHHRAPGAVAAALRAARSGTAVVELIADNTHLDPYVVASMFELLGADNIVLVTDAMAAAGLSDGQYRLGPAVVNVQGGVARLPSGALAGGTASMLDLVRNAVAAGVPAEDALHAATEVPARILGMSGRIGTLAPGASADILLVDADLRLVRVLRRGLWITAA